MTLELQMKSKYAKEYSNLKKMDMKVLNAGKLGFDFTKRNELYLNYGLTEDFTLMQITLAILNPFNRA